MKQYQFGLADHTEPAASMPASRAYPLYAWLLEWLPADAGEYIHWQGEKPVAQYLHYDVERKQTIWTISLLADWLADMAELVLKSMQSIELHDGKYDAQLLSCQEMPQAEELIA